MSYQIEVYLCATADPTREASLAERVSCLGGRLDFREVPDEGEPGGVCLTFEFPELDKAQAAVESMRRGGEHVEGPADYGP